MLRVIKKYLRKNDLIDLLIRSIRITNLYAKNKFLFYAFLGVFNSFLELFSIISIIPVIVVMLDPEQATTHPYISMIYSAIGNNSTHWFVVNMLLIVLAFFLLKNIFHVYILFIQNKYAFRVARYVSKNQLMMYLNLGYPFFVKNNTGALWRNIAIFPQEVSGILIAFMAILSEFFVLFLLIGTIALYNIEAFLAMIAVLLPVSLLFYRFFRMRLKRLGEEYKEAFAEVNKRLLITLHDYLDITMYGKEKFFVGNVMTEIDKIYANMVKNITIAGLPVKVIEWAVLLGILVIFVVCQTWLQQKEISLLISLYALAAFRSIPSLNRILTSMMRIRHAGFVISDLDFFNKSMSDIKANISDREQQMVNKRLEFKGKVELSDFSYRYEDNSLVFSNANFSFSKGECVGLIGSSGSGKSTLLRLLLQLVKPERGGLFIDGKMIDNETRRCWWNIVGYMQQDVYILDGTLLNNIAFGIKKEDVDEKLLLKCIKQSGLNKFLQELPDGLDTEMGEMGAKISGGQRQRIGLARVLYREPEILMLDEFTSSLDVETEIEVMRTIQNIVNDGKTVIIISHRESALEICTRVCRIEEGKIF